MLMFAKIKGVNNSAALFTYMDKGKYITLCHSKFVNTLKSVLKSIWYNSELYSGHSFRRAACSFASSCGVPTEMIKMQGDWRSEAYLQYLTVPLDIRWKCVDRVAKTESNLTIFIYYFFLFMITAQAKLFIETFERLTIYFYQIPWRQLVLFDNSYLLLLKKNTFYDLMYVICVYYSRKTFTIHLFWKWLFNQQDIT